MPGTNTTSRRTFVKTLAAGTAFSALSVPAASYARILGANERVSVGVIGMGRMARGHLRNLVAMPEAAQVVALSDVYQPNLQWGAQQAAQAETFTDFRKLLEHPDLDAVVVATPDHWHALPTVMACEAGKDVYVEKPTAVTIGESRKMVEAAQRTGRTVQVGTQQRSGAQFQKAAEIVQSGELGPISFVRTWNYGNDYPDGIGDPPDAEPVPGLDWEMWLGPAPEVPFNINRFGVVLGEDGEYQRWSSFRWFWDYAGGMMTDWGVHLLDIMVWAMDVRYPEKVSAAGGKFYLEDNRETPDTLLATYQYPNFVCTYENRTCNGRPLDGEGYGITFHGTEGTLFVNRGYMEVTPENGSSLEPMRMDAPGGDHAAHMQNFLGAITEGKPLRSDMETGHYSTAVAMLGNVAYRIGRTIEWDGEAEKAKGDADVDRLTAVRYRDPWTL
ncbi:MAG: Gfo/Idh/MocA family protein [Rhodothermales bacterium]